MLSYNCKTFQIRNLGCYSSRSRKRGGGETEMRSWKRALVPRVSRRALNIRQRVASGGIRGAQAPPRRGLGGGAAPPGRLGPWWPPPAELRGSGRFRNADFLYIFSGIFVTVFVMEKPEIQKQQKTETGTGVHRVNRLVQI